MTLKVPLTARVRALGSDREFNAIAHVTNSKAERLVDEHFYVKYSGGGFEGQHVELELLTEVDRLPYEKHIHYYRATSGIVFVCWTGHLPDIKAAKRVFDMWCVGTTYTITRGEDFARFYEEDPEKLIVKMREFDIHLLEG